MPFDWEKFRFKATSEEEKAIIFLFKQKHPEEYSKLETHIPINREKNICFFNGWITGLQEGRFLTDGIRLDLDVATGTDICSKCNESEGCEDFPCEKIESSLSNRKTEEA